MTHDHETEHTHTDGTMHEHAEGHGHGHGHGEGHSHEHGHHHDHPAPENREQLIALMDYMCRHNESHANELDKVIAKLDVDGCEEAAGLVRAAKASYDEGNRKLTEALSLIK